MRERLYSYINSAITIVLLVTAGVTPLLFFTRTTEFFDIPKLVFLIFTTVVLVGLWIFSWVLNGRISVTRTPLDLALIFLLITVIASAFFSPTRLVSIYGNFPRVHGSAVAWVIYILLYFVTVSHFRKFKNVKYLIYVLCGSGVIISVISLLSYFKIYLPFSFAQAVNFTPTGSSFSTIALLLMLIPLPILSLINKNKNMPFPVAAVLATLFGIVVVLIGSIPYLVVLALIFVGCLLISKPAQVKNSIKYFAGPLGIVSLVTILTYLPLSGPFGFLYNTANNFPKEVQLPLPVSWKIAASTFRDAPFFGTGPSSFSFNFTSYKPLEFNTLPFWNFSFDTAYNEPLLVAGTLGVFGIAALVIAMFVILRTSKRNLSIRRIEGEEADDASVILPALAISAIVSVVLLLLHATTLVSVVTTLFILAAFMMAQKPIREKVTELSLGIRATTSDNSKLDLFPVIVFVLFLIVAIPFMSRVAKASAADYYHRQALLQSATNGTKTYEYLQKAEQLNPNVALYRIDMAQTNFALANAIALQKGPTEANPQGTLTPEDQRTIQTLLSQAINEGRVAVALSPRSAANWELLGAVYRNITGVAQNALEFSLASYGQAIQRDPLNPALRVSVGGIYYAGKNYPLAIRFFSDAANLKPDYANAYYNLAIAMRDNNDLPNSVLVAQQLVNMLSKDQNSEDYKTAAALLSDLRSKLASQQQQAGQQSATTGESTSALQNPNLPNVTTLDNPPTVSPAPTVRPNPNANLPRPTATPVPTGQGN